jgi:hypothetical protein
MAANPWCPPRAMTGRQGGKRPETTKLSRWGGYRPPLLLGREGRHAPARPAPGAPREVDGADGPVTLVDNRRRRGRMRMPWWFCTPSSPRCEVIFHAGYGVAPLKSCAKNPAIGSANLFVQATTALLPLLPIASLPPLIDHSGAGSLRCGELLRARRSDTDLTSRLALC